MPTSIKTWIVPIKFKDIPLPKYIMALFSWVMSSLISNILCYKALNWLFVAIKTLAILVLDMISWIIISAY